jgi:hypothetical protein
MKLTQLKIHKFRSVPPGTELTFSPTLNLVLGENGTGRSALLDLVSLALGSDFSGLRGEAFSLEYEVVLPGMALRVFVRNELPASARGGGAALLPLRAPDAAAQYEPFVEVHLLLSEPVTEVVVRATDSRLSADVDDRPALSQSIRWSLLDRSVWVVLFMVAQYLEPKLKERLKSLLGHTFLLAPSRFDESLGMFEQIATTRFAMQVQEGGVFPLGLMALPSWLPVFLRDWAQREPSASAMDVHHHEVSQSFLARFVMLAGFAAGTLRVELLSKDASASGGRLEFGRFGFLFTRRDGSVVSQAHLGYGQKRLLSFLYYLDLNPDFAIADELANGLGPRWVEACMAELGTRQSFLTTQNPLVFEHVPLKSAEDFRASLVLCEVRRREGREQPIWCNPSPELAEKLVREHQLVGTPLGTLLRALQIW